MEEEVKNGHGYTQQRSAVASQAYILFTNKWKVKILEN